MSYQRKVYRKQGGDEMIVASGGAFTAESGSTVDLSGATLTLPASLVLPAALDLDSNTATLTTNAVTATKRAVQVTTESLTTAAGSSQALVITLAGVAATDLAFLQRAGGSSANGSAEWSVVCTTNTVTVTVTNRHASAAFNGTFIFNLLVFKA